MIETFTVGMLSTNCYVASCHDTKEAIIIDPGVDYEAEAQQITEYIEGAQLKIKYIINTHGHGDHIKGDRFLQEKYCVPILIHKLDAYFIEGLPAANAPPNVLLEEGSIITFGKETLKVLHTPGHTRGCICLLGEHLIFTGDTLFAGGIGRTDFPEGSMSDMNRSLQRLDELPDGLLVYPGHGEVTMIGEEKRVNPFLNHHHPDLSFRF
ncbi:MAG: MBL fold metallo-hydrolase [Candidatus Bathyarchaeota archaeon]|nr:MBL fold metallo-hydrolase [Candidatus Bathyarchaeota archaeon]